MHNDPHAAPSPERNPEGPPEMMLVERVLFERMAAAVDAPERNTERLVEALREITQVRSLIQAKEIAVATLAEFDTSKEKP